MNTSPLTLTAMEWLYAAETAAISTLSRLATGVGDETQGTLSCTDAPPPTGVAGLLNMALVRDFADVAPRPSCPNESVVDKLNASCTKA